MSFEDYGTPDDDIDFISNKNYTADPSIRDIISESDVASGTSEKREKEGDDLIPDNDFSSIAAPEKLHGTKAKTVEELLSKGKMVVYEDLLRIFVATKIYVTLWGPVGAGKTRTVEAFANETDNKNRNYNVITIQPSTTDPTSIHGLMTVEETHKGKFVTVRATPEPAKAVWDAFVNNDQLTVMFLDEMTTCNASQQQALLGLLTHAKFGDLDISNYVTFVSAANPPGTVSSVLDLEESVMNRGAHIPWYGEPEIFLEKYSQGFGNPNKIPDKKVLDFVRLLIDSDPEIAFRDDPEHYDGTEEDKKEFMWTVDTLVPYERMTFSPRILTQIADVYKLIRKIFADSPYEIKQLYIQEAAKAFAGPRWGKNSAKVYDYLESLASTEESVTAVSKNDITNTSTYEEVVEAVGDSLHRIKNEPMSHIQEEELANLFKEEIFYDGFRETLYRAFWVWLSTSSSEQRRGNVITIAFDILSKASRTVGKKMPRDAIFPKFVPKNIENEIKEMAAEIKRLSK